MARLIEVDDIPLGKTFRLVPVDDVQEPKFGQKVDAAVGDIPRQLGLTVRHGVQGISDTAGILYDPLAYLINKTTGSNISTLGGSTNQLLDYVGLPEPKNALERGIGKSSEMLSGAGGMIKGASAAANVAPLAYKSALSAFASNPTMQGASAVGSGGLGQYAKETGGSPLAQFLAALAGGIAAPVALSGINAAANAGGRAVNSLVNSVSTKTPEITINVTNALNNSGVDLSKMSYQAKNALIGDISEALKTGGNLKPEAIQRMAAYRSVGAIPTTGTISLNPAELTRQKNLAKMGANSADPKLQTLANVQNQNDRTLIDYLNGVADTGADQYSGASRIISALQAKADANKGVINSLYSQARDTAGRSANLDPHHFTQSANNALDGAMLGGKLPIDVRNTLNGVAKGDIPFTVDVAEQYKTAIGTLQRSSTDPSERMALGLVRKALDETPLLDNSGQGAIDAFNTARSANRAWMKQVEATPALKAVMDGVEPDKFVQNYIIGRGNNANVMDLYQLRRQLKNNPDAIDAVKGQIVSYLKESALGKGAQDDMANFSAAGYRKALDNIGERKLRAFFSKDDIQKLNDIKTVATAEKFQPTGSAVNNSNSATTMASYVVDALDGLAKTKYGAFLPGKGIVSSIKAGQALNAPRALVNSITRPPMAPSLAIPSLMLLQNGGLLTSE